MSIPDRVLARLRPRPLPSVGWLLGVRLLASMLPIFILLLDALVRNAGVLPLLTPWPAAALVTACLTLVAHHLLQRQLVRVLSLLSIGVAAVAVVHTGHLLAPLLDAWPLPSGFLRSLLPFFCAIVALTLFGASGSSRRHFWAMTNICLGTAIAALSLIGIAGEMYDILRWLEPEGAVTRGVLMRGLAGVSLGTALAIGATPLRLSLQSLRRWAHVAASVAVLFVAVLLAELLRLEEIRDLRATVAGRADQAVEQLENRFRVSTYELRRIARGGNPGGVDADETLAFEVWNYVETTTELRAVTRVDTQFVIEWSVPARRYPALEAGRALGGLLPSQVREPGRFSAEPVVAAPVQVAGMGRVFVYLVPTLDGRMTDGFIGGFFPIGAFLGEALGRAANRFGVLVQNADGRVLHDPGREDLRRARDYVVSRDWQPADAEWRVHVFPRRELLAESFTIMPLLVLLMGLLLAATLGATLYQAAFARVSVRRLQREVQRRARLESELRAYQQNLEELVARRTRELEQSNRKLRRLARTDALTGVLNRGRFEEEFEALLKRARRYRRALTLCLLDLDHFKAINDTHGHAVGDEVLQRVCEICRPSLRDADVFARYGGEEFAILMDATDLDEAHRVAERMRSTIERTPVVLANGLRLRVTASLGLATLAERTEGRKQLFQQADQALYRAKAGGRNRVEVWVPAGESG